jgi:hypothetical protein
MGQKVDTNKDISAITGQENSPEANRRYWLSYEGLSSESYFRERLHASVADAWDAFNGGDPARIERNIERIAWVEPFVQTEPLLSFYETGLVMATLPVAYYASTVFDLDRGFKVAERCREVLIGKRNRRREMGLSYRPDSECWFRLYQVLAELKWKGGDEHRNQIVSPENLVCDYLKIERRCQQYFDGQPVPNPKENDRVLNALGWCGLQVIKMATRWCPQHVNVLIDDFNRTHGTSLLNQQAGHFLDSTPTDPRNPWYWDFELFKWCMFGPATRDEATLCHQWRLDSARALYKDSLNLSNYLSYSNRELEFLLSPARQLHAPRPS